MSDQTFSKLISLSERMKRVYSLQFALAGGDPTAHPKYADYTIGLANIAPTTLVTHGCNFEHSDLSNLARRQNVQVQFSIPSMDLSDFKFITGGACLKTVLRNLAKCVSLGVPVSISSVVSEKSLGTRHAEEIIALAKAAGVPRVMFNRFLPAGRGTLYKDELSLLEDEFSQYVQTAKRRAAASSVEVYLSEELALVRDAKIRSPKLSICYDGKIRVCSMASSSIGSIDDDFQFFLKEYVQFWSGGAVDNGCTCSRLA